MGEAEGMVNYFKKSFLGILIVLVLTGLDQSTKHLAVLHLKGKSSIVFIKGVFELSYLENTGAAFGIFQNQRWVFMILTTFVILIIGYLYIRLPDKKRYRFLSASLLLLLAGAVGNMIDRTINGYVVDFFYFSLIDFPVFNVADIYVVLSAFFCLLLFFFYYTDEEFDEILSLLTRPGKKKEHLKNGE